MLASLLPGLRDVRTPLAVGYLWLLNLWLAFDEKLIGLLSPKGAIGSHLTDLHDFFGQSAAIAAVSFIAFLLGSMVTIRSDSRFWRLAMSISSKSNEIEAVQFIIDTLNSERINNYSDPPTDSILPADDFRARLLAANQEMYGEYDRLDAEAVFRFNIALPISMLSLIFILQPGTPWLARLIMFTVSGAVVAALLLQASNRKWLAEAVLLRSMTAGIIEHPFIATERRLHAERMEEAQMRNDVIERQKRVARRSSEKRESLIVNIDMLAQLHENLRLSNQLVTGAPDGSAEEVREQESSKYWQEQIAKSKQEILRHFDED